MNFVLLHADLSRGYRLARFLQRHSLHTQPKVLGVRAHPDELAQWLECWRPEAALCVGGIASGYAAPAGFTKPWFISANDEPGPVLLDELERLISPPSQAAEPRSLAQRMESADDYFRMVVRLRGRFWAEVSELATEDMMWAIGRIEQLQGPSPWDDAWPTENGVIPARQRGWDRTGEYKPTVLRRVRRELKAAGRLPEI